MEPLEKIQNIINKLYDNKLLGPDELAKLELWLVSHHSHPETDAWLNTNWKESANISTDLSSDEIRRRISQNKEKIKKQKLQHWAHQIQRIAAVLLVPLLAFTTWLAFNHFQDSPQWLALTTKQGERTHVVLPDGSEVWINVDSRLEYATNFNQKNRDLKLQGEAYFKVKKGEKLPFIVSAKDFKVQAVGTEFNISAYNDENKASTFLKEGIVKFTYSPDKSPRREFEMKQGEQVLVNIPENSIRLTPSPSTKLDSWRKGELYFENEPMDAVFRKMERWYGITIHFTPEEFTGETLVVTLKNGEPVERLLEIINNAIGIEVKKNENEYRITKKG